jgi:hypothetical protein
MTDVSFYLHLINSYKNKEAMNTKKLGFNVLF